MDFPPPNCLQHVYPSSSSYFTSSCRSPPRRPRSPPLRLAESRAGRRPASVAVASIPLAMTRATMEVDCRHHCRHHCRHRCHRELPPPSRSPRQPRWDRRRRTPRGPPSTRWRSRAGCSLPRSYSCSARWNRWPRWNRPHTTRPRPARSACCGRRTGPWCHTRPPARWRLLSRTRAPRPWRWHCPRPFPKCARVVRCEVMET